MAGTVHSNATINLFVNSGQALENLKNFQNAFNSGISRMRNMVIGFIGAKGLKGYYDSLLQIVDLADRWHLPVEKVSAWTNLFAQFGGSAEDAGASLEKLQSMANDLKFHSSGPLRELSAVLNTNLQNKDYMGAVRSLREGIKNLNADAKTEVMRMLGFDSAAMQRLLESTDEDFASALKSAQEFGVMTEKDATSLREMQKTLADIKQTLLGLAIPFVRAIKPILEIVRDIARWFGELPDDVKELIAKLVTAGLVFKGIFGNGMFGIGGGGFLKTAGIIGFSADVFNGIYQGLKKAYEEGLNLQETLDEMAKHSYVLNITLKIANKLGEWIGGLFSDTKKNRAAIATRLHADATKAFGSDFGAQGMGLVRTKQWLDTHQNHRSYDQILHNYKIMQAEHNAELQRRAHEMFGPPDWVGKQSPTTNNDNRSMTFNIYGVDGAGDLENRLSSIINNNVSPVTGWAK